ncbi:MULTISPECIES: DUF6392 family protein [Pseudomonas]|uniref:DUF6392 family protein n=1 Tax=Pseudomonas TaxID=286 RepID=UPI000578EBBC|nr:MULTISPECIES: DUF6392 family protein [Pseudomonas]
MNLSNIDTWLSSVGQTYQDLVRKKIISDTPFIELYPGTDYLHIEPERGVDFGFFAETKKLEAICITLQKIAPSQIDYAGELSAPYGSLKTRDAVHEFFGVPFEQKGPMTLPLPVGKTGGWDLYHLSSKGHENIRVIFKYNVNLEVCSLVFSLLDKGRD